MHAWFIFPSLQRGILMLKSRNGVGEFTPMLSFGWLSSVLACKNFPGCSSACKVLYIALTLFSERYTRRKSTVGKYIILNWFQKHSASVCVFVLGFAYVNLVFTSRNWCSITIETPIVIHILKSAQYMILQQFASLFSYIFFLKNF